MTDPTADSAGRRTPRTEAGRALLDSLHAQSPVVVPIEQDAAAICRIEDEARAAGPREAPPCRRCGYDAAAYRALATEGEPHGG